MSAQREMRGRESSVERMRTYWRWIAAHWSWLTEERWPWIMGVVVVGVLLVAWFAPGDLEPRVRLAGMVLQLCGVGTVAFGIRKTRRFFREKSYRERFREWLGRRPGDRTAGLVGQGLLIQQGDVLAGVGDIGWCTAPSGASPDERIAALEWNMQLARNGLENGRRHLEEETNKRTAGIDAERQRRERGDEEVRAVIREAAAGGLDLSVMGVVWLFAGIVLGTASREIACLLGSAY